MCDSIFDAENDWIDIIAVSRMDGFLEHTLFKIVTSSRCIFHRNARMLRIVFPTRRIACLLRILQSKLLTLNTFWMLHKPSYFDFVVEHFSSSEPRKNWQRFMGNCFRARCAAMRLPLFRKLCGITLVARENDLDAHSSAKVRFCDWK